MKGYGAPRRRQSCLEKKKIKIQRVKIKLTSESFILPFPWVNDNWDCMTYGVTSACFHSLPVPRKVWSNNIAVFIRRQYVVIAGLGKSCHVYFTDLVSWEMNKSLT